MSRFVLSIRTPQYVAQTTNIYPDKIKLCLEAILSLVYHNPPLLPRYYNILNLRPAPSSYRFCQECTTPMRAPRTLGKKAT
jgi:hypothetical protein